MPEAMSHRFRVLGRSAARRFASRMALLTASPREEASWRGISADMAGLRRALVSFGR